MILGMSTAVFTLLHVIISLIGIATGFIVLLGLLQGKLFSGINTAFLIFTILTSVTGFFYPITKITPGIILGVLSLIVLAIALYALYAKRLTGGWKRIYAITAMIAQYFNTFVLVAQSFQKTPFLKALPPFAFGATQIVVLCFFVYFIYRVSKSFHNAV